MEWAVLSWKEVWSGLCSYLPMMIWQVQVHGLADATLIP